MNPVAKPYNGPENIRKSRREGVSCIGRNIRYTLRAMRGRQEPRQGADRERASAQARLLTLLMHDNPP
uniref:Transposase n=1 Tax=Candidatus Kentrum sp. MB TaxID=2138164 RepID=A0A450X0R7_9GAMM|nr:MAG: hypothetical protein BECKMB1821G_GA0114241_100324 [Candidatus Kentron sp. MB]